MGHHRHCGTALRVNADVVWLASYPKSGNTWVRAILTALSSPPDAVRLEALDAGAQPYSVAASLAALAMDSRWFTVGENEQIRASLIGDAQDRAGDALGEDRARVRMRKTHEVFRTGDGAAEPFPTDATRAAILIVRDPRDVACSHAAYFGTTIDAAIEALASESAGGGASPARAVTAQPWGSWSGHTRSWLSGQAPFPVHVVRYEDLQADAVGALSAVLAAVGLPTADDQLLQAVELAAFERLREQEAASGFRERGRSAQAFFRRGRAGGWREELTDAQARSIEEAHATVMHELGYLTDTGAAGAGT